MNKSILIILLSFMSYNLFSQKGGQSFDSIPTDYEFVKLSFAILSDIRNGDLTKVESKYPIDYKVDLEKELINLCLKDGKIRDTSMIEHYWNSENDTEISFNFECDKVLNFIIRSEDKDGKIKNVKIEIEEGLKELTIPLK